MELVIRLIVAIGVLLLMPLLILMILWDWIRGRL
jgi:hypothetical protein